MVKTTLKIDGMACTMCESHVNEAVRRVVDAKKVTSSFKKGETEIISAEAPDEAALRKSIEATGYKVLAVTTVPYEKKGIFGIF